MFAAYVTVTIVAAVFTGTAAATYLTGHDYPKAQADMKRIPRSWVPGLGLCLAAGSLGLLTGFAVPLVGTLAAAGPVLSVNGLACSSGLGRAIRGWRPRCCAWPSATRSIRLPGWPTAIHLMSSPTSPLTLPSR